MNNYICFGLLCICLSVRLAASVLSYCYKDKDEKEIIKNTCISRIYLYSSNYMYLVGLIISVLSYYLQISKGFYAGAIITILGVILKSI